MITKLTLNPILYYKNTLSPFKKTHSKTILNKKILPEMGTTNQTME